MFSYSNVDILGKYSDDLFMHPFWLDTYYDQVTGKFHFTKSGDLVDKFNFIVPMVPDGV